MLQYLVSALALAVAKEASESPVTSQQSATPVESSICVQLTQWAIKGNQPLSRRPHIVTDSNFPFVLPSSYFALHNSFYDFIAFTHIAMPMRCRCPTDLWMRRLEEPFRLSSFVFPFCLWNSNIELSVFKTQTKAKRP